jgi:replicative DNA helicase
MIEISNIEVKAERMVAARRDQERAPRNIEVEQALLGAMLRVPGLYAQVAGILEPGHFWVPEHIELFGIMTRREGRNLTPASLKAEFEARTELPVEFLYDLATNVITVTPGNVAHYGHTIRAMAQRRSLIGLAQEMKERAEDLTVDESPDDMIGVFNGELSDIASVSATFESAGSVAKRVVTNLDKPIDADLTGICGYFIFCISRYHHASNC